MTDEKLTFESWSDLWDKLFSVCKMRGDFRALLAHTTRYKRKWNWGR